MTVQKIKSGRIPGLDADNFVGDNGQLFFNEGLGDLRLGDGITPGGIPLSVGGGGGGGYILPTASTTIKGGVKVDGTTITISNQVISGFSGSYNDLTNKPTIPTNTNQLTNGAGFITNSALSGYATESFVTTRGYLTSVSWNDVQSKPTFATVATSGSYNDLINRPSLFSGSYNDLTNKPTIPTNTNELVNGAGYITSSALTGYATETFVTTRGYLTSVSWNDVQSKPTFATVATSGSYTDLINKPTIPSDISDLTDTQGLLGQGGGGTTTITNNIENPYTFSVAGDDSTLREISNGETLRFAGATGITITSDAEGKITITGPDLSSYATQSYVTTQGYITSSALTGYATETYVTSQGYITASALTGLATESFVTTRGYLTSVSWNQLTDKPNLAGTYSWSIAADDSTQIEISSGNLVKIVGSRGVTTTSNADGQITITGPDLSSYATQSYVTTALASAGVTVSATAPTGLLNGALWYNSTDLELYVRYEGQWVATAATFSGNYNDLTNKPTNVSAFTNDAGYTTRDEVYAMILELAG